MRAARTLFLFVGLACAPAFVASAVETAAPATTPLTRELLLGNLARELSTHFNLEGDLQLEFLRTWTPPAQVASRWDLNVLEFPSIAASSMLVRCRVLADGAIAAETTFVLRASLWRDAWVARQPLAANGSFDAALLEVRRVDTFRERDVLPAAVGDATYIFTRPVTPGRLLTWRDIALRPLVKKGERVEVSASDGLLLVTMQGIALENGARGETVTVRNPESKKDFAALVVDENRVQVRF
jgi:flagella basal body P-ring formation protein FlgA